MRGIKGSVVFVRGSSEYVKVFYDDLVYYISKPNYEELLRVSNPNTTSIGAHHLYMEGLSVVVINPKLNIIRKSDLHLEVIMDLL